MLKRISLVTLIAFTLIGSLCAVDLGTYNFAMLTSVSEGSGTVDDIGDITGDDADGIKLYIGYKEGPYSSDVTIKDCKPLDNQSTPADVSIVAPDSESAGMYDEVTIYVAADSNVSKETTVNIRFDLGSGWQLDSNKDIEPIAIVADINAADVTDEESNVKALASGDSLLSLIAKTGEPKKEDAKIVGYSVLSWPNDGMITAGDYSATVSVELASGN